MSLTDLTWLALAAYGLHILEEYTFDWRNWARNVLTLPVEWEHFYVTNALVIVLGAVAAELAATQPMLALAFPALMLINATFFQRNFWQFSDLVNKGELDILLTKPVSPAFLALTRWMSLTSILNFFLGIGIAVKYADAAGFTGGLKWALVPLWLAVGVASLTGSRPVTLIAVIGWNTLATGILYLSTFLGPLRDLVLLIALGDLFPGQQVGTRAHPGSSIALNNFKLSMPAAVAVLVILAWAVTPVLAGAWRTRTRDA